MLAQIINSRMMDLLNESFSALIVVIQNTEVFCPGLWGHCSLHGSLRLRVEEEVGPQGNLIPL